MTKRNRIALGLTQHGRQIPAKVFNAWVGLLRQNHFPGPIYLQYELYVLDARNRVVKTALEDDEPWDYLWFWDSDQAPNPKHIECVETAKEPIVGGLYFRREPPFDALVYDYLPKGTVGQEPDAAGNLVTYTVGEGGTFRVADSARVMKMIQQRGMYECDGVGTGDLLIRRDVLERMAKDKGRTDMVFDTPRFEGTEKFRGGVWGEDLYFCLEAKRDYGYKVWIDSRRESQHIREEPVDARNWLATHNIPIGQAPAMSKLWLPK